MQDYFLFAAVSKAALICKSHMSYSVCSCAVCSKTLWIGHLNKHTTEQELSSELSQFGEVTSVNVSLCYMVHFVVMLMLCTIA